MGIPDPQCDYVHAHEIHSHPIINKFSLEQMEILYECLPPLILQSWLTLSFIRLTFLWNIHIQCSIQYMSCVRIRI